MMMNDDEWMDDEQVHGSQSVNQVEACTDDSCIIASGDANPCRLIKNHSAAQSYTCTPEQRGESSEEKRKAKGERRDSHIFSLRYR